MSISLGSHVATLGSGQGHVVVSLIGTRAVLSTLRYSYPLKLMAPDGRSRPDVQTLYMLSYGGGLVSGDRISLDIDLDANTILCLLTQGSTKVYRTRAGRPPSAAIPARPEPKAKTPSPATRQMLRARVAEGATLFLLPAPVTCFSGSSYSQTQRIQLASSTSTLVLLDWFTSGRKSLGEHWAFNRYRSSNTAWRSDRPRGTPIVRDVVLLADDYVPAVHPFSCFANVLLLGPKAAKTLESIRTRWAGVTQYRTKGRETFMWSFSELDGGRGGVLRCAGEETEAVRDWLKEALNPLETVVGRDAWRSAWT
jgi:urease accessory protein